MRPEEAGTQPKSSMRLDDISRRGGPQTNSRPVTEIPGPWRPQEYPDSVLSDRDRLVLEFERAWWLLPGPKEAAIREHLEMSATRYYQALTRLLDDRDALEYDPLTIRRLRRLRESRRRERLDRRRQGDAGGPSKNT